VHLSDEQGWIASFVLAEELRPDAAAAVAALQAEGVTVRLLSGDRDSAAREIAARAGIEFAQGGCTPEEKLEVLWRLQAEGRQVAMVGDGLNDGPSLARANASFAFGRAVPLARARADFVVPGDAHHRAGAANAARGAAEPCMGGRLQRAVRAAGRHGLAARLAGRAGHGGEFAGGGAQCGAARGPHRGQGSALMDILFLLIPLSVVLVLAILGGLWWAIERCQFEDIEIEGDRILRGD
jgi:cbb3-type cytochrome oxidase maturation protein